MTFRPPSHEQKQSQAALVEKYHGQIAEGGVQDYLTSRGITRRAIDRFKLGSDGTRLVIPYLTPAGPWQFKYRCVKDHNCKDEHGGKYAYDDGAQQLLYNTQTLLTADRVVIVEGELDAISVEMAGAPAVAYPGVTNWQKWFAWCFDSVEEITVVADGDEPGEKAATSVADSLRSRLPDVDVRRVVLPAGEDSNSFINNEGQLAYLERIGFI